MPAQPAKQFYQEDFPALSEFKELTNGAERRYFIFSSSTHKKEEIWTRIC